MLSAAANCVLLGSVASAAEFAAHVISYDSGTGISQTSPDSTAALGSPAGLTGVSIGFPNVLSHFNAAWEANQIVQIGDGGHLTLQLSHYALVGAGLEIGVVENVAVAAPSYPTPHSGPVASLLGVDVAMVEVSDDGLNWVSLNGGSPIDFSMPGNFYTNAGAFDVAPPAVPVASDWGQPIAPLAVSAFDNMSDADLISLYGGAGGGTWLDLSGIGLLQVGWVRFSDPGDTLEIDAVIISNTAVGAVIAAPVPEPASGLLLALGSLLTMFVGRRRSSRNQGR
jgi:hypothetical protein